MTYPRCFILLVFAFVLALPSGIGQTKKSIQTLDSLQESHISKIISVEQPDSTKAIVRVIVMETGKTAGQIQGATVLLKRDKDKMLGRVSGHDGRCDFMPSAAYYTIRVQLTGYKSLETSKIQFVEGRAYDIELRLAFNE